MTLTSISSRDIALKRRELGLPTKLETGILKVTPYKFLSKLFLPDCHYDFYSYLQPFDRDIKNKHFNRP